MLVPIILLILGFAFVVAEVLFVSMGVLGLLAMACIVGADAMAFEQGSLQGWILIVVEIVCIPLLVWLTFRALPHLPFGRRMLLGGPGTTPAGGFASLDHLLGRDGEALTDLRPSGTALLGDERLSVVAIGGLIPRGAEVKVVDVEGPEVRVRATDLPEEEETF